MRISVDGEVAFEGRIAPGETKVFEADDQVMVLTGNAAALRITYNGRDLGLMGNVGEVVSRVYLITGVATPTANDLADADQYTASDDHADAYVHANVYANRHTARWRVVNCEMQSTELLTFYSLLRFLTKKF